MKKWLLLTLLLAGCSSGVAGSGTRKNESRTIAACTDVQMDGVYQVEITADAAAPSLSLEGDDNLLPLISTEVSAGKLVIHSEQPLRPSKPIVIKLALADLQRVGCSGACDLRVVGVHADQFQLSASGAGKLALTGETHDLKIDLSGACEVKAEDLKARSVKLSVSGAGNASVFASSDLDVDLSGAGKVDYYGKPANVKKSISGVGTLNSK